MRRQALTIALACGGLAACVPVVPDSGVGFNDYTEYQVAQATRDAELTGPGLSGAPPVSSERLPALQAPSQGSGALDTARAALAEPGSENALADAEADAETRARNSGVAPLDASPSNAAPPLRNNPDISDEQDFDAVSGRRGIEGDAARLAQARAQYRLVTPQALPERRDDGRLTPVEFALSTSHPLGQRVWRRSGFTSADRARRNCGNYATPDRAQADFLANGGPERDRLGLDPDGDGFVCGWDPAPFRRAVNG